MLKEKLKVDIRQLVCDLSQHYCYSLIIVYVQRPILETDVLLYNALRKEVNDINLASLSWTDHEANMVLSDRSPIVKRLTYAGLCGKNKREFDQKIFLIY